MTRTAGEAREALLKKKQAARNRSYNRLLDRYREDDQTESDLAFAAFDDGWKAGYTAGFQMALDTTKDSFANLIAAQRSGIMSTDP